MAQVVNPNADIIGKNQALSMNCAAGKGLQSLVKTNLGPKGTMKMYVKHIFLDSIVLVHATLATLGS